MSTVLHHLMPNFFEKRNLFKVNSGLHPFSQWSLVEMSKKINQREEMVNQSDYSLIKILN